MKVIVYPHELSIGGSQINAIDLAAVVRDLGHEVIVYGWRGPLEDYVTQEKGLRYVAARELRYRPAPTRIAQLAALARRERADVIHTYEWPPCLDAFFGADLIGGVPVICTVLSMDVSPLVPSTVPLLMGTEELADEARRRFGGTVGLMEPPIDTDLDRPENDGTAFRREHGIADDELLIVTVSRLSLDLKLDALVDAIDAAGVLAERHPVRLLMAGDGDAADQVRARAAIVNERLGREVVTPIGAVMDPRPAYAAADCVVGMGSSALRAMAHAKPVVVQGERGFARLFDEDSASQFFWTGFYGVGPGGSAADAVVAGLEPLLESPARRAEVGAYGLSVVLDRFSLRGAADRIVETYEAAIRDRPPTRAQLREAVRVGWGALGVEYRNHLPSHKRRQQADAAARLSAAATADAVPAVAPPN